MKKTKCLIVLMAVGLLTVLSSCKGNATPSGGGNNSAYKAGDIALANIVINGTTYENTAEVYVTGPNGATIVGEDPSFVDSSADDKYKGVFRTGRTVTLSPYIMSKYEVTGELYYFVMIGALEGRISADPSLCRDSPAENEEIIYRPVENVSWYDAVYFCNELTKKTIGESEQVYTITNIETTGQHIWSATVTMDITKKGYRLPTEAEWEFAARGGDPLNPAWNYLFSGHATESGKTFFDVENSGLDAVGWYKKNSDHKTHAVGSKGENSCNALGIYDMSGNVFEWCYDYKDSILTENVINPSGPESGNYNRVARGGSHGCRADETTVYLRRSNHPENHDSNQGFRVVRSAQ
jgi:formylglycine-generating enzyme required for sulfatase activity